MALSDDCICLPGFGLPIEYMPPLDYEDNHGIIHGAPYRLPNTVAQIARGRFPHAIADYFTGHGISLRERRMLDFINKITDKEEWDFNVFDKTMVEKWRKETCRHIAELDDEYLSKQMWLSCMAELYAKASRYEETSIATVLDVEASAAKSDRVIPQQLRETLRASIRPLEDVPERRKDWHSHSDDMVLDLLHPSLFPLIYGRSRVLAKGRVPLLDCTKYIGKGEILSAPAKPEAELYETEFSWFRTRQLHAWGNFQWLPADVCFAANGGVKITSYINNLLPEANQELYNTLEQFVTQAVPLWNEVLNFSQNRNRIRVDRSADEVHFRDPPKGLKPPHDYDDDDFGDEEHWEWYLANRVFIQPEPVLHMEHCGPSPINLRKRFAASGLQVIFKLASIHLTPEKAAYDGGKWHIEGALNEHICATALYYIDEENVTDSHLSFRHRIDSEKVGYIMAQCEWDGSKKNGVKNLERASQDVGSILTRSGRLLAFPNVLQHRVSSFRLVDPSKPGHRKILAMFLVDPHIWVLSTANVPPQRRDWWAVEIQAIPRFNKLPQEIFEMIIDAIDDSPISWEDALEIREDLMAERGSLTDEIEAEVDEDVFDFCEH
ncbi:uncharacterized protein BDZ99DRAFT_508479 [Mytilinidion resinicola]|uniref:Uncharacterized protein n=1 Tax=Mytilinidion resinicola TaxID=574789 RepID=A0A6A6YTE0_9PEZI|nr:uncharacterized protein BDZ99DRAFT_508479 [Mytilinidion resinicola]KAF2811177.1 hypothetical protein BDZ99DRAFT_508479 [Mytilinidion resinicola]